MPDGKNGGTALASSLRAFENYPQRVHRPAPAFIRDVLANFCHGSLKAAAAADALASLAAASPPWPPLTAAPAPLQKLARLFTNRPK